MTSDTFPLRVVSPLPSTTIMSTWTQAASTLWAAAVGHPLQAFRGALAGTQRPTAFQRERQREHHVASYLSRGSSQCPAQARLAFDVFVFHGSLKNCFGLSHALSRGSLYKRLPFAASKRLLSALVRRITLFANQKNSFLCESELRKKKTFVVEMRVSCNYKLKYVTLNHQLHLNEIESDRTP